MLNVSTRKKLGALIVAIVLTMLVAVLDRYTGREISLAVYYMFPVVFAAWEFGFTWALIFSLAAFVLVVLTARAIGHPHSQSYVFYFDAANILLALLLVAFLAARLRKAWDAQQLLSRTDALTGIPNRRTFHEAVETEINRQARVRLPFALVYLDCDDLKRVNDTRGHKEGDQVLIAFARTLSGSLRRSDVVARLGGDEFGVLLPLTDAPESLIVARALQDKLRAAMEKGGWPVTVSIGIASYGEPPESVGEAIDEADKIMYEVKQSGKNSLRQREFP